jgi:thiol-disulfide isomerase/thioredoxin
MHMKNITLILTILPALLLGACTIVKQPSSIRNDAVMMDKTKEMGNVAKDDTAMEQKNEAMKKDAMVDNQKAMESDKMQKEGDAMVQKGVYTAYSEGILENGTTKVLFFHAAWCPRCRKVEADLKAWYIDTGFPLTVYKVDYDTETALKSRYGITYQHTFVKVDGQGNVIEKIQGPSDEQLMELLQ